MSITSSAQYLFSYQNTCNETYAGLIGTLTYPATTQLIGSSAFTSNAPFSNIVYTDGYNCNAVYFPGTAGAYYNYGTGTTFPLVNLTASSGWAQTTSANQMIGKTTSDTTMNGEMYSIFTFTTALSDADRIIVEAAS
jgi:hypothetical protein